jgi:hypothetical protein
VIADFGTHGASFLSRLALVCVLALLAFGALTTSAVAAVPYEFNSPTVSAVGDEEVVFDAFDEETGQLKDQCSNIEPDPDNPIGDSDITNAPARAYRSGNQVVLFASHFTTRRFTGPNLNDVTHSCAVVMQSGGHDDPAAFHDREWLQAFWTKNGQNVYALVHEEFQGWWPWRNLGCDSTSPFVEQQKCLRSSITLATSTNGGALFTANGCLEPTLEVPCGLVAASPYRYETSPPIGPYGYFNPSNIVESPDDGMLYALIKSIRTSSTPDQKNGTCLIRTANTDAALADPESWQAWNGTDFSALFVNPYTDDTEPKSDHVCEPVDPDIAGFSASLTYSEYFHKYVLVDRGINPTPGVYFATSSDLINWDKPKLLMKAEVPPLSGDADCVAPHPVRTPSLLDPSKGRDNFDTIGRTPYLYYARIIMEFDDQNRCVLGQNRDLARIKIDFGSTAPPVTPPGDGGGAGAAGDGGGNDAQPDTKAARVTITSGKKQDVDKLAITFKLDENATVEAGATVNVPGGASKVYSFKKVRKDIAAGKTVKIRLKMAKKNLKKVKRALRRGKKLTAKVKITATDVDGNNSTKRSSIKLKP